MERKLSFTLKVTANKYLLVSRRKTEKLGTDLRGKIKANYGIGSFIKRERDLARRELILKVTI